jgi:hypothetical protein
MARHTLKDRFVASLLKKPAKPGTRDEYWDTLLPSFGVIVTEKGHASYVIAKRIAGAKRPARRKVGNVGAISLADAREKARGWLALIEPDPGGEEQAARRAKQAGEHRRVRR